MKEIQPDKIIETITNKKTGEKYKNDAEWKAKGYHQKTLEEM